MPSPVFVNLLVHRATVRRNEPAVGSIKQLTDGYKILATNVACRLTPIKVDSLQAVGGVVFDADHKARLLPATDVRETDKLTINGHDYLVMGAPDPFTDSAAPHHRLVYLKKQETTASDKKT